MMEEYDDPYDPDTPSFQNETRPLDIVIKEAIDAVLLDLHTWLPARVVKVNGDRSVDVQPLLKRRYRDGTLVDLPILQNCMVSVPRGTTWSIDLPIAIGDSGLALFCERSLDNFSTSGGEPVDPADPRHHDLSDAIFVPGLYPLTNPLSGDGSELKITNGLAAIDLKVTGEATFGNGIAELRVTPVGKVALGNEVVELLSLIDSLIDTLLSATVVDPISGALPFSPSVLAQLTATKVLLALLKA